MGRGVAVLGGALALGLALALGGCGAAAGPRAAGTATAARRIARAGSATAARRTDRTRVAQADRTHELSTPVPHESVLGGWRTPAQAVEVFAATYINWTAATVAVRLRALAEVCIGQARSAVTLAASETAGDYELRHGGIANSGTVEAVTPLAGAGGRYVVVTRELTTATGSGAYRGLAPTWHVTLATVTRITGGLWVLSDWQPES